MQPIEMKWQGLAIVILALSAMLGTRPSAKADDHASKLDELLSRGQVAAAEKYFADVVATQMSDQVARTAQGLCQFLQALEFLGQANHRYGLIQQHAQNLPLARLPVPENPDPQRLSYDQLRQVIAGFQERLQTAEQTLAQVETAEVKLPLYLGRVCLDLNGDAAFDEEETLWQIFAAINTGIDRQQGEAFFITVDGADVHWLRGYCHFLMAICDVVLAYDERDLFERCGQLLFPNTESPFRDALQSHDPDEEMFARQIMDAVAAIHLMRFSLIEQNRMPAAHAHLLAMIEQSRLCWQRAGAETDDDHEWIPNPNQSGVLQVRVTGEVITGWHRVLDELEEILEGRRLIPYWRDYLNGIPGLWGQPEVPARGRGVNLRKVFHEPTDFDLVLTLQGSHVQPYLEEGELSTPEAWDELTQVFQGQFFGFAIWFN